MLYSKVYDKIIEASSIDVSKIKEISECAEKENRIPKIIHFCFLDYKNITQLHIDYIKTWFEVLDDTYTFVNWTPGIKSPVCEFESMTFKNNKFAFYSDYIRSAIVYEYGGVYMDCDVKVLKPFDELLGFDYVFDTETNQNYVECASFMAKKNNMFVGFVKDRYESIEGEDYSRIDNDFLAPKFWAYTLMKKGVTIGINSASNLEEYKNLLLLNKRNIMYALDGTFLSCMIPPDKNTMKTIEPHENTFTRHGFEGTWSY